MSTAIETLTTQVDGQTVLIGSACTTCSTVTFPAAKSCPSCGGSAVEPTSLATRGKVWTWTVQRFSPKAPFRTPTTGFAPFAVAYVDLGNVRIEARLAGKSIDAWRIGDSVRLVVGPLPDDADGYETFWFEPA